MYKVKKKYLGCSLQNVVTKEVTYLNNATTQKVLKQLYLSNHPAVEEVIIKKKETEETNE